MSWPESKCEACPARDGVCQAQATRHRRFCDLANPDHPAFSEHYRRHLCGEQVPAVEKKPCSNVAVEALTVPSTAIVDSQIRKAEKCPHASCGCNQRTCKPTGRRPGQVVTIGECVVCVAEFETPQPTSPSLGRKVVNFAKALVEHVAAGMPEVDDAIYETRLTTCQGCSLNLGDEPLTCSHPTCGCPMRRKAWWAEQACPIGKWPAK
ncbi:hypothetical protein ACYOEI_11205 [Singulisphaera rosea]